MTEAHIVVFTQIDAPGRRPGCHWQASLYLDDHGRLTYPAAIAWISDFSDAPTPLVSLDFVLVADHFRRKGYATALIRECELRWPDIWLTDPISEAGEALLESICD